jgi:hypothetical protein
MAEFDIFNPKVSQVVAGIEGKCILIHSNERKVGKTAQACKMPQPLYLRFESGINAIPNIPYMELTNWSDFKKVNKQLTNQKTLAQAKEKYKTIIFDTVDVAIKWCEQYICASEGVATIGQGNNGYGLWKEYENEWFKEINKLTNAGYAIYFISHSEEKKQVDPITDEEYVQMCPKGDKRTIDLILDLVDIIGYVKGGGISEDGDEVLSSVYFANTKEFMGGSRFKYLPKVLTPFTAEGLQKALKEAVEKEEKESGTKSITFEEKQEIEKKTKMSHDELISAIEPLMKKLWKTHQEEVTDIVTEYLGEGAKVSETTKKQNQQLEMILSDLQDLDEE